MRLQTKQESLMNNHSIGPLGWDESEFNAVIDIIDTRFGLRHTIQHFLNWTLKIEQNWTFNIFIIWSVAPKDNIVLYLWLPLVDISLSEQP